MIALEISRVEVLALKKLAIICGALGKTLNGDAAREQLALTSVLVDVVRRAEAVNDARGA